MSLYAKIRDLPLKVDSYELVPHAMGVPSGWTRRTTEVHLLGDGSRGVGEDVTYQDPDQEAFQKAGACLPLSGTTTLDGFSRLLDQHPLFGSDPADAKSLLYRRWAFESAALDLALQQAGLSLASALGRTPKPLRFVVSLGLGDPPSVAALDRLWTSYPDMELKLDANPDWNDALVAELAATGKVTTVDLKGQYHGPFSGMPPNADVYRAVAKGLPNAWIEDPAWTDGTREALAEFSERVTYDAPVCSLADVLRMSPAPKCVNIKPSRFGLVSELFRVYEFCEARGVTMYGGGQFELASGRGQLQVLASLFHPETANDVAPSGFNLAELPDDLPTSPLAPAHAETGFRWKA